MTDVEACINSRPLAKLLEGADDENLSCITPSHLIIGKTLRRIHPEIHQHIDSSRKNIDLVKRWKIRDKLAKLFWSRWTKEYLSELRQYHNTNQFTTNLKPGDYCLVLTEKTGKYDWPTAVVTDVCKGRDGSVRTVEVKLPNSVADIDPKGHPLKQIKTIRRGIESIILLEASRE